MNEKSKVIRSVRTPVAIVGMGVSGQSALSLLLAAGLDRSAIATFDHQRPADFNDSAQLMTSFRPASLVVSPGVWLKLPWIEEFSASGGLITSELEIASQILSLEKVIAVTGSVGKSTTVSLIGAGLKGAGETLFVGGNLGTPLADYARSLIGGASPVKWILLELSSYQLENFPSLQCDIGAIVSLTPNHLERYESLQEYYRTKLTLGEHCRGRLICNKSGADLESWLLQNAPSKILSKVIWTDRNDPSIIPHKIQTARLLGTHNQDNLAVACKVAEEAHLPLSGFEAMREFPGLPHRLENLGIKRGVLFVNDSKATTLESVLTAVHSLLSQTQGVIHLLIGGRDKGLPWEKLATLGKFSSVKFYFFGECGSLAKQKSGLSGALSATLLGAIEGAMKAATAGDTLLLSPGGTSLDEFKNYEDRGDFLKEFFRGLN